MSEYLTVEQIAKDLQVTEETVRIWIRNRKLIAVRIGRDYRVKREDFEKFIEQRRTDGEENTKD